MRGRFHHLRRRRRQRQIHPCGGAGRSASNRSASRSCSRASRAARPAPRSSATFCCPASPSRSGAETEAILFAAARDDHVRSSIRPALLAGKWVICDRFIDSTRVYQGALGKVDGKLIRGLERVTVGAAMPDLTFILDVPAKVGLARAKRRRGKGAADRFEAESVEFHEALRKAYRDAGGQRAEALRRDRRPRAARRGGGTDLGRGRAAPASRAARGGNGGAVSDDEADSDVLRPRETERAVRPRRGRARAAREPTKAAAFRMPG